MFEALKQKIACYLVKRKFLKEKNLSLSFNNFFKNSHSFLLILPELDEEFNQCIKIPEYLVALQKNVELVLYEPKLSLINENYKYRAYTYGINDKTKFNLPDNKFLAQLQNNFYDIVIDLNINGDEFSGSITNAVKSNYRIGFQTPQNEEMYNIQIKCNKTDAQTSYANLLETLKMF